MIISYNWLKDYLGKDIPTVTKLAELLTLHSFEIEEVTNLENDTLIDIKVLPDRAGDCLSHRGIAREIATLIDVPLIFDPLAEKINLPTTDNFLITIENEKDCSRFMVAHMTGVEIKPSPKWLQERLITIGQKSINNIVDATNYVMYALGQPMHAYDADLFLKTQDGKWHFDIRRSKVGETLVLLKDNSNTGTREIKLTGNELLIVDGAKDSSIGLAGVKGGKYASINPQTKNIIIEAANFDSTLTRQTAKKHNINTDAVKRFENKPTEALPPLAINNIIKLIKEIAGGNLEGVFDLYPNPSKSVVVLVRTNKVNKILGLTLNDIEIKNILERLGAKVEVVTEGFSVTSPIERNDLIIEANYIEEVGRVYGLDKIASIVPQTRLLTEINTNYYYCQKIRQVLLEEGFSEVMTSTFRNQDEIKLQNSLASDKSCLRSSLMPAIKETLMFNVQNVDVLGLRDIRIFEIGKVFRKGEKQILESLVLTIGAQTKKTGYNSVDEKIVKKALEALHEIGIGNNLVIENGICEINLEEIIKDLPAPTQYDSFVNGVDIVYKPFSTYPAITRDIAIWVDGEVSKEKVIEIIKDAATTLCNRITLFDEFAKDGRVSYAFRLVFQAMDKTLTDVEVEPCMDAVYRSVKEAGFETR